MSNRGINNKVPIDITIHEGFRKRSDDSPYSSVGDETLMGSFRTNQSRSSYAGYFNQYQSVAVTIHRCDKILCKPKNGTKENHELFVITRLGGLEMQSDPVQTSNGCPIFESTFLYPFDCHRSVRFLLAEIITRSDNNMDRETEVVGIGKADLPSMVTNQLEASAQFH